MTKVLQSNDIKSALQSVAKNISEVSSPVQREELLKNVTEYLKTLLSKKESAKNGIFGISIGSLPFLHVVGGNETVPETTTSPETTVITTTHEKEVKTTTEAPTTTTTTLPVTTTVTTTEPVHTTLATTTVANDTEVISLIKSLTALTNAQLQSNITHNTTEAPITTTEVATTAENITVEHHNETTTTSESIVNETTTTHSALIELINKTEVVDNITNYLLTHVFANTTEEPQTTAYNATINITEAVFPTLSSNVTEHNITTEGHLVVITEATVNETTTNATEIILIPELVNTTEIVANTTTLFENTTVTVLIATATNETTTTGNITIIRELHNETNRVGFELRVIKGKNWEEGLANPDSPEFNHFRQELEPGVILSKIGLQTLVIAYYEFQILKIMKDSLPKDQFAGGKVTKFM